MAWFGRNRSDSKENVQDDGKAEGSGPGRDHPQAALMDEISCFLLDNGLAISIRNLATAQIAFSGTNFALNRRIAGCRIAGIAITQEWLDRTAAEEGALDVETSSAEFLEKLNDGVNRFQGTTREARQATGQYVSDVSAHVQEMQQQPGGDGALQTLVALSTAMLERTRAVEEALKRSEDEAGALRESLEKARDDATIDHLTGLPNRRAFEEVLENQYRQAQLAVENLCVAFVDIDHFKRVNDSFGHDVGDRVLKEVGRVLADISNDTCHVARHGGEEFVLLFRDRSLDDAYLLLDRTRERLAQRNIRNRDTDEPLGQISFSGGLASVFEFSDPRAALKAADAALYMAKDAGRNRICLAKA
jgi:diguanylate cyclase